jgi:peptidoglycan/LPS O-acetylase OafA/YrhL
MLDGQAIGPSGLLPLRQGVQAQPATAAPVPDETRVVALDGLRGLMTLFVLISHFFAEVPNGSQLFAVGWIGVTMFFVLSGYLVGKLVLEKKDHSNFFAVFYVRRACRTLPVYIVCVLVVFLCLRVFAAQPWMHTGIAFPLWSYLTFNQNFFMVATDNIGDHWLAPTWTLSVEEHFYLLAPAVFIFVPRRHLLSVLIAAGLATILFRIVVSTTAWLPAMSLLVLLPGVADALICGLLAAVLIKIDTVRWARYDNLLRVAPIVLLLGAAALRLVDGATGNSFRIFGPLLVALACASFILSVVRGAPEANRLRSKMLCFFGATSYSVYLTHLAVLGLMHGLLLGRAPDVGTFQELAVTVAALPVAVFVGWALTKLVEEPITSYGRSWKWSYAARA